MNTAFAKLVAASLRAERFTLVDVGCSGGIDPVWRLFGDRFRAVGFDASVAEYRRLTEQETHADVRYVPGFVDIPPDHPFALHSDGKPVLPENPFARFSAAWALEIRAERLKTASLQEKLQHNAWALTELADPAKPIFVPDVLRNIGFADIDFLKIDIDGSDFRVLNSLDGQFDRLGLLAARLEVNLFGRTGDTLHSFHNTDRFMRARGFELIALENRSYSMRALPANFTNTEPAQTVTGRVYQAEAFYARDPAAANGADFAASLSAEKLAKLAAIFSVWGQPDGAAEILVSFRDRLSPLFSVDDALDLLAAQTQSGKNKPLSYRDYMELFASDSPQFYLPAWTQPPKPTFVERLTAALRAYRDPDGAFRPQR